MNNFYTYLLLTGAIAGGALGLQELKGQDYFWGRPEFPPTERINFFTSQGDEPKSLEFNALKTDAERRAFGQVQMYNDITHTIPGSVFWTCNRIVPQYIYNGNIALWTPNMLLDGNLVYSGNSYVAIDSIYKYGGTNEFFRTTGIPAIFAGYKTPDANHTSNGFMAGDSVAVGTHWCFQEVTLAPWGQPDLKPGQSYLPISTDEFVVYASFLHTDEQGQKHAVNAPALLFKLVNGVYQFIEKSPYLDIIMERDTLAPVADVYFGSDNLLHYYASDENFKKGIIRINGLADILVRDSVGVINPDTLGLADGTYTAEFVAEDYFLLMGVDSTPFIVSHTPVSDIRSLDDLVVYPNPFKDFLSVGGNRTSPVATSADLINTNGQILRQFKLDFGVGVFDERLNVDGLLPGNYMLRVKSVMPDGKVEQEVEKLIKVSY
jgi:hypothetical protein